MAGEVDISVEFAGLNLANPVWTASGTCGYTDELSDFMDVNRLGGFITKSVTLRPREGNDVPRVVETDSGMLNAIGLANVGVEEFITDKAPALEKTDLRGVREYSGRNDRRLRRGRTAAL